jgi:hypothetical protein
MRIDQANGIDANGDGVAASEEGPPSGHPPAVVRAPCAGSGLDPGVSRRDLLGAARDSSICIRRETIGKGGA